MRNLSFLKIRSEPFASGLGSQREGRSDEAIAFGIQLFDGRAQARIRARGSVLGAAPTRLVAPSYAAPTAQFYFEDAICLGRVVALDLVFSASIALQYLRDGLLEGRVASIISAGRRW